MVLSRLIPYAYSTPDRDGEAATPPPSYESLTSTRSMLRAGMRDAAHFFFRVLRGLAARLGAHTKGRKKKNDGWYARRRSGLVRGAEKGPRS